MRRIIRLPNTAHNYIVSNLGHCVIERLDRRLFKYIHKLLHSDNVTVKEITLHKLVSPTSVLAENYRYLCHKYLYCA